MEIDYIDGLGKRRLRAAADLAYASAMYDAAEDAAAASGVRMSRDLTVSAARAYVKQARLIYEQAKLDHENALDAAIARELVFAA